MKCWIFFPPSNLALNSWKNYPPRLVIINNDDNSINNCFVVGGGIKVDIGNDAKNAVTKLLFCYYVWDLSYPKQNQLLGFLQTSVLRGQRKQIWYEWKLSEVHTEVWGEIETEVIVIFSLYSTFAYLCKIWITLIISNHCFSMFSIHCLYKIFIFMFFPLFTFSYEDVCLKFLQH